MLHKDVFCDQQIEHIINLEWKNRWMTRQRNRALIHQKIYFGLRQQL